MAETVILENREDKVTEYATDTKQKPIESKPIKHALVSIEDRKTYASEILGLYRQVVEEAGEEPPLELKKQILRMLVDTIWVDDQTKMARIDGVIPSTVDIMEISFASPLTRK